MRHSAILSCTIMAVVTLALLGGCTKVSVTTMPSTQVQKFPPMDPGIVGILRSEPTRPHLRLGEIEIEPHVKQSSAELEQQLQEAAGALGADAAVIVADPANLLGGTTATSWWGRGVAPVHGEDIVAVAIRYLQ